MEEGRNGGAEWVRVGWWVCYLFCIWVVIWGEKVGWDGDSGNVYC